MHEPPVDAAYQGQPGAYSEQAARRICGAAATLLPCETLADVFAALADGRAPAAVIPIENTLAGAVPGALRLLFDSGLTVDAETTEWIDHVLAGPAETTIGSLREVLSHPVALAQCTQFFRAHPHIRAVPVFDTAGAMEMVMRGPRADRAAVAGRAAAALYGAAILAEHVQDHDANYTRFVRILARGRHAAPPPTPARAMFSLRLPHRRGSLARALTTLADGGLNLRRIDSSPIPGSPFEYEFLLEAAIDAGTDVVPIVASLAETMNVRLIGILSAIEPE